MLRYSLLYQTLSTSMCIGSISSPADLFTVSSPLPHSSVNLNLWMSCCSLLVTITFQPRSTRPSSTGSLTLPPLLFHKIFLRSCFTDWASAAVSPNFPPLLLHWLSLWCCFTKRFLYCCFTNSFSAVASVTEPPLLFHRAPETSARGAAAASQGGRKHLQFHSPNA